MEVHSVQFRIGIPKFTDAESSNVSRWHKETYLLNLNIDTHNIHGVLDCNGCVGGCNMKHFRPHHQGLTWEGKGAAAHCPINFRCLLKNATKCQSLCFSILKWTVFGPLPPPIFRTLWILDHNTFSFLHRRQLFYGFSWNFTAWIYLIYYNGKFLVSVHRRRILQVNLSNQRSKYPNKTVTSNILGLERP